MTRPAISAALSNDGPPTQSQRRASGCANAAGIRTTVAPAGNGPVPGYTPDPWTSSTREDSCSAIGHLKLFHRQDLELAVAPYHRNAQNVRVPREQQVDTCIGDAQVDDPQPLDSFRKHGVRKRDTPRGCVDVD